MRSADSNFASFALSWLVLLVAEAARPALPYSHYSTTRKNSPLTEPPLCDTPSGRPQPTDSGIWPHETAAPPIAGGGVGSGSGFLRKWACVWGGGGMAPKLFADAMSRWGLLERVHRHRIPEYSHHCGRFPACFGAPTTKLLNPGYTRDKQVIWEI